MHQTHVRNVAPMHEANRRRWDRIKTEKAIAVLLALGWRREPGSGVMLPPAEETVKTASV
jgi:hypothetical protein